MFRVRVLMRRLITTGLIAIPLMSCLSKRHEDALEVSALVSVRTLPEHAVWHGTQSRPPEDQECAGNKDHTAETTLSVSENLDAAAVGDIRERRRKALERPQVVRASCMEESVLEVTVSYEGDDPASDSVAIVLRTDGSAGPARASATVRFSTHVGERGVWERVNGWVRVGPSPWRKGNEVVIDYQLFGVQCGRWRSIADVVVAKL